MDYVKNNEDVLRRFRELECSAPLDNMPQPIGEDGLLYRGEFCTLPHGAILRMPGDEESMWHECKCRVMFVTKDVNGETYDIRMDPARSPEANQITAPFFKKMAFAVFGFHHVEGGKAPNFSELDETACADYYEHAPIVRINCKKTAGAESLSRNTFCRYTFHSPTRSALLVEQIRLWHPAVIVSCGSDTVYPFLHQRCFHHWVNHESSNGGSHYFYCPEERIIVINGAHPAAATRYGVYYNCLMSAYEDALERYPAFRARVL